MDTIKNVKDMKLDQDNGNLLHLLWLHRGPYVGLVRKGGRT